MDTPKVLPIEPVDMIRGCRLRLFCDALHDTKLEMGTARGKTMGEQVACHDEEQKQKHEGGSCLDIERSCE